MDILTHALSGIACGIVFSSFSKRENSDKIKIIVLSGFGGILPDFDAISLSSRFDGTLGRFFSLSNSGHTIYFSKFWYSHHGFLHSLAGGLLFVILIGLFVYISSRIFHKNQEKNIITSFKNNALILSGFMLGFFFHLLEDMPTPHFVWGGVRLLWPLDNYIGGTGDVWWWNNYDIFLLVSVLVFGNFIFLIIQTVSKKNLSKFIVSSFVIVFILSIYQIKTRTYDFNYIGQTTKSEEFKIQSKEVQKEILGQKLYSFMEKFDNKMKVNF